MAFLVQGVGGEGDEVVSVRSELDQPEEVLDAPRPGSRVLPERVAFEVEEDVARVRLRDGGQGTVVQNDVGDAVDGAVNLAGTGLRPRLILQLGRRL